MYRTTGRFNGRDVAHAAFNTQERSASVMLFSAPFALTPGEDPHARRRCCDSAMTDDNPCHEHLQLISQTFCLASRPAVLKPPRTRFGERAAIGSTQPFFRAKANPRVTSILAGGLRAVEVPSVDYAPMIRVRALYLHPIFMQTKPMGAQRSIHPCLTLSTGLLTKFPRCRSEHTQW